jgi:hypothetical protein
MPPKKDVSPARSTPSKADPKKPGTAGAGAKGGGKKASSPNTSPNKAKSNKAVEEVKVIVKSLEEILAEARKEHEEKLKLEAEQQALEEANRPPPVLQPSELMEKFVHQFLKVLADEPKKTEIYFGNDVNAALVVDHHIRVGDSEHIGTALAVRGLGFGFYPDAHNALHYVLLLFSGCFMGCHCK